jgi:lysine 6-dehydrogenase
LLTEALLEHKLGESVPDVILLRIEASGTLDGAPTTLREELMAYSDPARGLSAMARCTGYPAAIITTLIATGEISARGAKPQEECVPATRFRECLKERGLELRYSEVGG